MEFQLGARRWSVWIMKDVTMASQFERNLRSVLHASDLFNRVPMPSEFEWLRWSIEPVSSKQQTEAHWEDSTLQR